VLVGYSGFHQATHGRAEKKMMALTLFLLIGLPRSGKSTIVREMGDAPIVNPDSIRLALHGQRFVPSAEPFVWAIAQTMVKALFEAGHPKVYLDATNITKKRRKMWITDEWETVAVWVDTTVSQCFERAMTEGDDEIIPIITDMAKKMECPDEDEGFSNIIFGKDLKR
jgi:predicted kinase